MGNAEYMGVSELQSSDSTSLAMKLCLLAIALAYVSQQAEARDVLCGKSTTVPINGLTYPVKPGDKFTVKTRKMTNDDGDKCRRGDFMRVKIEEDSLPEVYCQKNKPTTQYPAVSTQTMKIWYEAEPPTFAYRNKGMTCEVYCEN